MALSPATEQHLLPFVICSFCVVAMLLHSIFFQHAIIIKFKQEQVSHAHACTTTKFKINDVDMGSDHHPLPKYWKKYCTVNRW